MLDFLGIGKTILNKLFPDKAERQQYELKLLELQNEGAFKEEEMRYSAILAEAQSVDKWTSRARPSFLYVMYTIILASIPLGVLYSYNPQLSMNISDGFKLWLDAIPGDLWMLFGAGFLGYTLLPDLGKKMASKALLSASPFK